MNAVNLLPPQSDGHVEMVMPWYVNGTLPEAQRAALESHLSQCAQCRASHQLEVSLRQQFRASDPTHESTLAADWAALCDRLEASDAAANPVTIAAAAPRRWRLAPQRRARRAMLSLLLLAQAAAIAVLAIALVHVLNEKNTASYRTLTDSPSLEQPHAPALRVVFADETTNAAIRALLAQIGGTISSGPGTHNVYTVRLTGVQGRPARPAQEAAKWLRSQDGVLFAEPIAFPML